MHKCFYLILFFFILDTAVCQNQANIWYFGHYCGLDFNSGEPEVLQNGQTYTIGGSSTMSDINGNLLFYVDDNAVLNKEHEIMQNGDGLLGQGNVNGTVIAKWPGNQYLYYILHLIQTGNGTGMYSTIVDMQFNNGLGKVIEKNTYIDAAWDTEGRIALVKREGSDSYWAIVRKFTEDAMAAFEIDQNGLNTTPILSEMPDREGGGWDWGFIKVSYDKKYLVSSYHMDKEIEVCRFDARSGKVNYLYTIYEPGSDPHITGMEFSPDSKYLYVSFVKVGYNDIFQFEVKYIEDKIAFNNSAILVGSGQGMGMQLARDGKIYCAKHHANYQEYYLGVINKPWLKGTDCNYEEDVLFMYPGEVTWAFPNQLIDYLFRFDHEGTCRGEIFQFTHNFLPEPDSMFWNFGDPGSGFENNISYEHNPSHIFSDSGYFEVSVDVWYPTGRFEHTSREIYVEYSPEPDLGPDIAICQGDSVLLDAWCGDYQYTWNTLQSGPSIYVSDTGNYWVRVRTDAPCTGIDTIHVAFHPPAVIDTSDMEIFPTSCGESNGMILDLQVNGTEPLQYTWIDDLGNVVGNTLDITGLSVGNYSLIVTDSNNCQYQSPSFGISDAGDIQILQIDFGQEHCGQGDGFIHIQASSAASQHLLYSIDNENNYFDNLGVFDDLSEGTYAIFVKDSLGCKTAWSENPLTLISTSAPQITDTLVVDATDGMDNGEIHIQASGISDTLYYSIGGPSQVNNGDFTGLASGIYNCSIADEYGCITYFTLEVENEITIKLQAVAGDDEACPGNTAFVPLRVSNFEQVSRFRVELLYDNSLLDCQGFANTHSLLAPNLNAQLFPAEGRILLQWDSLPINLPDESVICQLVFTGSGGSQSQVQWNGETGVSYFLDEQGEPIPVEYTLGNVKIYREIELVLNEEKRVCQGDMTFITPFASGGNGQLEYKWIYPNGVEVYEEDLGLFDVQPSDQGIYTLHISDTAGCSISSACQLIVEPAPMAAFASEDTIAFSESLQLDAGEGMQSYLWNTGDTTHDIIITQQGWYRVNMTSYVGCSSADSVFALHRYLILNIPNAFSPNGDGLNDEFKVVLQSSYVPHFNMKIFNRWGQMIFETKDPYRGWDGKIKGKNAPQAVYVYQISYEYIGVEEKEIEEIETGSFVLIR
ncbi:MAG: gliding motility-associated C-terminal domain-containing protein [Bacteroidales bacterium]|nr:gliding motility-associated C-terminal domain-containing protein [Bacteroidales bacterium]MCF8397921.1 gliding motility-associated C-terminal domain-containing protein [Bacteroidales bacterium]